MNGKYDKNTIISLLKIMLAVRKDLTDEEKANVLKLAEQIINNPKKDYEDKQKFFIEDYKRRN